MYVENDNCGFTDKPRMSASVNASPGSVSDVNGAGQGEPFDHEDSVPLDYDIHSELRETLYIFFLNPIDKWRYKKKFPYKLLVQVLKIFFVTTQVSFTLLDLFSLCFVLFEPLIKTYSSLLSFQVDTVRRISVLPRFLHEDDGDGDEALVHQDVGRSERSHCVSSTNWRPCCLYSR
jgi:hypothetical protein